MLNLIDEFTHECLAIRVNRKLNSTDVIDVLSVPANFTARIDALGKIDCRVGEDVAILTPHRPGRADFPHPVLHERDSLAVA